MITDWGLSYDQDVANGNTAAVDFYVGLISNDFAEAGTLDAADIGVTLTEFTDYTSSTRPALVTPASTNGVTVCDPLIITVNANSSVAYGAFVATVATKGAATGHIYAIKKFPAPLTRDSGQDITIDLTLTTANA
jgi:hypothetical protein